MPRSALSDGTLRFLALSIIELDPDAQGLLCFEEPENGIHPERISSMLRLLENLTVDVENTVGPDNPLRQVIVNTHSPSVVGLVTDENLLVAEKQEVLVEGKRSQAVNFAWLSDTWRANKNPDVRTVSRGFLGSYLNPLAFEDSVVDIPGKPTKNKPHEPRRVKDREDLQLLLPIVSANG